MTKLAESPAAPAFSAEGAPAFPPRFDPDKLSSFMSRLMGDLSATLVSLLCALGDRLGLFRALATSGAVTSAELAATTRTQERYVREWLSALASAGYLDHDPDAGRYSLPPEHAPALAQEGGPMFLGGGYQQILGLVKPLGHLLAAFVKGGGVPQAAYGEDLLSGMERMSAAWFDCLLVQRWLPLAPEVVSRLERGATVADLGCGSGRAILDLARAFPRSCFYGFDLFGPAVHRATEHAAAAGLGDRVTFEQRDVLQGLPSRYDLITTFDSLHDFRDPAAGVREIRRALKPDGSYLMLEMNCSDDPRENVGPVAALLYSVSLLYNVPVSLGDGGPGLGTMGFPESVVRQLCALAGFDSVRRLPIMDPFNALYLARPRS